MTNPNERLTSKQVSKEFNIPDGTLRRWRKTSYPRHHRYFTGRVYYIRHELEHDLSFNKQFPE